MQSISEIARDIVAREGGFVNDPDDPGGVTKHGVTMHTLRRLGLDLTGDGRVDTADINAITPKIAQDLFIKNYYEAPRITRLPPSLQASVFDMYVNAGSNAVRILQSLLSRMGYEIAVDGGIGPQTARVTQQAFDEAGEYLVDAYAIARRNYYYTVADTRPASRKFARARKGGKGGWIKRAEAFMAAKYHLSAAAHADRTQQWR